MQLCPLQWQGSQADCNPSVNLPADFANAAGLGLMMIG
jgi:hypothetical protein